jgi:hypothetical protein
MTNDEIKMYEIDGYDVQENGIVRLPDGILIGRLSELTELKEIKKTLEGRDMQVLACDQYIATLEKELEAARTARAMTDGALVDQHGHIKQLEALLVRYLT